MKTNKTTAWAVMVLLVAGAAACGGGGKYGSAKSLINKQIAVMESYADDMEKAGSAADVAKALNEYAAAQKDLIPAMKKFEEQFPEIKEQKDFPAELKPEMDKMQQVMGRIMSASMKAAQYMSDPIVQEAQQKLNEAMASMK